MKPSRISMLLLLTAPFVAFLSGCGGGGSGQSAPSIKPEQFHGTWIEVRKQGGTGRFAPAPPKSPNLRQLTISADGSFKLEVVSPEGKPLGKPETASGRWELKQSLTFNTSENKLSDKLKGWNPTEVMNIGKTDDGGMLLNVLHGDENTATYELKK